MTDLSIRNGTGQRVIFLLIVWVLATLLFTTDVQSSGKNSDKTDIKIVLRNAVSGERAANPAEFTDILIVRDRQSISAVPNMRLRPGDLVATGSLEAIITFDGDEKEIVVGSNSQIDILNPSIRAVFGDVIIKIKKRLAEASEATRDLFRVEAEYVQAVAEGTIFYLRTSKEMTEVRVFEGRVRMNPTIQGGESLQLESGEMASFRPNKAPDKRRMDRSQIDEILVKARRVERAVPPYSGRLIMPPSVPKPVVSEPPVVTPTDTPSADKSELVREVKRLLLALGYDPGPVNAEENASTKSAIRVFKQSRNLSGLPDIDEPLVTALRLAKKELDRSQPLPPVDRESIKGIDATAGNKVYGKEIMTPDELIECIRQDQRAEARKSLLEKSSAQLNPRIKELDTLLEALDQQLKTLDRNEQAAVEKYNAEVAEYEKLTEEYNEVTVADHNEVLKSYKDALERCNTMCADRKYYIDDYLTAQDTLRLKALWDSQCGL